MSVLNISCRDVAEQKMDDENYFCVRFARLFLRMKKILLTPVKFIMSLLVLEVKAMSRCRGMLLQAIDCKDKKMFFVGIVRVLAAPSQCLSWPPYDDMNLNAKKCVEFTIM